MREIWRENSMPEHDATCIDEEVFFFLTICNSFFQMFLLQFTVPGNQENFLPQKSFSFFVLLGLQVTIPQ